MEAVLPVINIRPRGYNQIKIKHTSLIKPTNKPFLVQNKTKEVTSTTQLKKTKRLLKIMTQTCVSFFAVGIPTFATNSIVSPEIMSIFTQLELMGVTIGVSIAIITLTLAGIQRMLRQRKKSLDWTIDILKGLTQVLVAPILVMGLAHLVYYLFAGSSWFVSPLQLR